jgi:hypothetical protein
MGLPTVRRHRLAAAAVVAPLAAVVMSGCGVNFDAQTDQPYNPAAGVDDRSGSVDVLNALIVSGSDGSGAFVATLVNNSQSKGDTLKGLSGVGADTAVKATAPTTTAIAPNGVLNLAASGPVDVTGKRVVAGNFVNLRLSFDNGKAITLKAPVVSADDPQYAQVALPSSSASTSASPSGSASGVPTPSTSQTSTVAPSTSESPAGTEGASPTKEPGN